MEFWGVEVKAGQPLKVKPTFDNIIHLSQASLGGSKKEKGHESVPLYVKFGDKKLVLGTLIPENIPQLSFDLVFEKEFELSHNWKNGIVYFCGYQTPLPQDSSDEFDMEDSDEEEKELLPAIPATVNGKAGPMAEKAKAENAKVATPKANAAKPAKPTKDVKPEEHDDESDDEEDSDDEMVVGDDSDEISGDDDGSGDDDDDDDEDDSEDEDSDEEEETPKKAEVGKKRPTESAPKTPIPAKKAKTPMTDGKKGGHVATPHPSKGTKTPNTKTQTPKSGGQHTCSPCSKTFNSDNALQSHTKAKHSSAK